MNLLHIRDYIIYSKYREGHNVIVWNMIGTILMSLQSVIMLAIINRIGTTNEAGVFAIASTLGNQFVIIGNFSMRTFQASDTKAEYSFYDYLNMRIITISVMLFAALLYCFFILFVQRETVNKAWIIILAVFLKVVDALEDVYNGHYHQCGRLDIAAKFQIFRHIVTLLFFAIAYFFSKTLSISLIISTCISLLTLFVVNKLTIKTFVPYENKFYKKHVIKLFLQCSPLFLGSFLLAYIGNSAKYSIDKYQPSEVQAYYSFIFMPVFAINLINGLLYNPYIGQISSLWINKNIKKLKIELYKFVIIIFVIASLCILVSSFCGVPILSLIYGADLRPNKKEFMCLMVGGGFNALVGFCCTIITIMRRQNLMLICYSVGAIIAYILADWGVRMYGITGAAASYTICMSIVCLMLSVCIILTFCQQGEMND